MRAAGPAGKDEHTMKIAVTYQGGAVFQHFGHTQEFKLYEVQDGQVVGAQVIPAPGSGHGALAGFLREQGVQVLLCGGIGAGAKEALAQAGIRLYGGVQGSADDAVQALIGGTLSYDPDAHCQGHGTHENHTCNHHCGEDKGGCKGHAAQ